MAHLTKGFVVLFAALLLATVAEPAFALLYNSLLYNSWSPTSNISDLTDDSIAAGSPNGGTDITGIWSAMANGKYYFRMDVAGPITASDHANLYGIFIRDSANPNNLTIPSFPDTSNAVEALAFGFGNHLVMVPFNFEAGNGSVHFRNVSFQLTNDTSSATLEWSIPASQLGGAFSYMGVTLSTRALGGVADTASVAPIPSAAWLLGSGIFALVGLKRRKAKAGNLLSCVI